jgi:hypothetical protein
MQTVGLSLKDTLTSQLHYSLMPSTLTSPGSKAATGRAKRFNPYDRPSPHVGASSDENSERLTAPLMRRFAMCFNEYDVRLGQETVNEHGVFVIT